MKAWMRSKVSVVMRPPSRSRRTSLPSLIASRPKVDSATSARRQYSEISRSSVSGSMVGWTIGTSFEFEHRWAISSRVPYGRWDLYGHRLDDDGSARKTERFKKRLPTNLSWDAVGVGLN